MSFHTLRCYARIRYAISNAYGLAFHCDNWFTRLRFRMLHPVTAAKYSRIVRLARQGIATWEA